MAHRYAQLFVSVYLNVCIHCICVFVSTCLYCCICALLEALQLHECGAHLGSSKAAVLNGGGIENKVKQCKVGEGKTRCSGVWLGNRNEQCKLGNRNELEQCKVGKM